MKSPLTESLPKQTPIIKKAIPYLTAEKLKFTNMKTRILFLMLFIASYGFSQTVNDYKAVVIPMKYDFQKSDNQYRLQTITKMNLEKAGFHAFYSNENVLAEFSDRCSILYVDVKKDNAFLTTKLFVVFKDCYGNVVFQSAVGKSREKEFESAYVEALNLAFANIYTLNYTYNGNTNFSQKPGIADKVFSQMMTPNSTTPVAPSTNVPVVSAPVVVPAVAAVVPASVPKTEPKSVENNSKNLLYAQPTSYGYQLIDSEPKVVMKVYKTSNPASYMAKKGDIQGALVAKGNEWFFEYYQNDTLVSEKIEVKF
jgi:hypothetical protein